MYAYRAHRSQAGTEEPSGGHFLGADRGTRPQAARSFSALPPATVGLAALGSGLMN
jgi:hypothetical protein